jgi:hypothetical protein
MEVLTEGKEIFLVSESFVAKPPGIAWFLPVPGVKEFTRNLRAIRKTAWSPHKTSIGN